MRGHRATSRHERGRSLGARRLTRALEEQLPVAQPPHEGLVVLAARHCQRVGARVQAHAEDGGWEHTSGRPSARPRPAVPGAARAAAWGRGSPECRAKVTSLSSGAGGPPCRAPPTSSSSSSVSQASSSSPSAATASSNSASASATSTSCISAASSSAGSGGQSLRYGGPWGGVPTPGTVGEGQRQGWVRPAEGMGRGVTPRGWGTGEVVTPRALTGAGGAQLHHLDDLLVAVEEHHGAGAGAGAARGLHAGHRSPQRRSGARWEGAGAAPPIASEDWAAAANPHARRRPRPRPPQQGTLSPAPHARPWGMLGGVVPGPLSAAARGVSGRRGDNMAAARLRGFFSAAARLIGVRTPQPRSSQTVAETQPRLDPSRPQSIEYVPTRKAKSTMRVVGVAWAIGFPSGILLFLLTKREVDRNRLEQLQSLRNIKMANVGPEAEQQYRGVLHKTGRN
uniref:PNKD metallo-beta-lactamase domain containing n=1 Tax=Crocodylus porosus TaxID=8502 RepID=A0A7M4FQ15_CROPO